jgi:hypothetical protein
MNTSILTVVLAGALLAGQNGTPTWQNSYTAAQKMGTEQQKPVLVVIGTGENGWSKVLREAPSPEVTELLAKKYVCAYVDTATPEGKKLAQSFEITGNGLVISDRACSYQAFWHQGDLTNQQMARCLETCADPRMVVRSTATLTTIRDSSYPPVQPGEKVDSPVKQRAPVWHSDYPKALEMAAEKKMPIAMVFGSGANGAAMMLGASPSPECMQLLCDKYICVYVDMTTPMGKRLAQECSITADTGLVISDRVGATQAFWHQGPLAADTMLRCLNRYCDPQITVRTTETANTVRTSFYPTAETDGGYGGGFSGGSITGGSYCPSCNNARRR